MAYILQVDFKTDGPFGEEMTSAFADLAESINQEEGFKWKIWTENKDAMEAGGIYLFESKETAEKYVDMHTKRLSGFGITDVNAKIFSVQTQLTSVNHGPAN